MNDDARMRFEGRWDQLKVRVKETWGDLTDDDVDRTEGNGTRSSEDQGKDGESVDAIQDMLRKLRD